MSKNLLQSLTAAQALYNTRLKTYGEDFTKEMCCSRPIFNPHGMELHKNDKPPLNLCTVAYATEPAPPLDIEPPKERDRSDSLKRARDKVFDIAYANDFTHMITLTCDGTSFGRNDSAAALQALQTWCKNAVQRQNLAYVICPEWHEDLKCVHFHGFIKGDLPMSDSKTVFVAERKKPIKASYAKKLGYNALKTVYNLDGWRYGFSTAVELDSNKSAAATYITKYITKETDKIFGRYYFSGGSLKRNVPTTYRNEFYCEYQGIEYAIPNAYLSVKYNTERTGKNDN